MFEEQGIIAELRGMQTRLERAIAQLSQLNYRQSDLTDQLRSVAGVCDGLIRLWHMTDEEVADQHLLNVYDRPRERMLDLMMKRLQEELKGKEQLLRGRSRYEQIEFDWSDKK